MKINRIKAIFLAIIISATAVGCASETSFISFQTKQEGIVGKIVDGTRTAKIYRDLDTILIADILLYSREIKKAYADEMLQQRRLDDATYKKLVSEIESSDKTEVEFFAGLYTGEKKWNDFANKNSIWSIRLVGKGGKLISPKRIELVKRKDILDAQFFAFITPWRVMYRIIFHKKDVSNLSVKELKVYSALGSSRFRW